MRDSDSISDLFTRADPARTPAAAEPTAAQLRVRDEIMAGGPAPVATHRLWRRRLAIALPLAAAIAVIAIVAGQVLTPTPAAAYGPRPLTITASDETAADAVARLANVLETSRETQDARSSSFDQWALSIAHTGAPTASISVQASVSDLDWSPDGNARLVITAAEPFFADGSRGTPQLDHDYPPGEVISDDEFAAGEYIPGLADLTFLDSSDADILRMLGLPPDADAGDVAPLIMMVQNEWTPSGPHTARILRLLASLDGFSLDGRTTDRLGRDAIAFGLRSDSNPHRAWTVLASPESGRIIGLEEHVVGDDPTIEVPPNTVTQYFAWH